ncbi:MAG: hypothetical protein HYY18_19550 [Planctomycetes bacterium]|nr:hypothetical protein [Planctomycetota bacterium]
MPYDPRAFPELRKSSSGTLLAPPAPARKGRPTVERAAHYRSLRRSAIRFTLLLFAGFVGIFVWERQQREVPAAPAPVRTGVSADDLARWEQTLTFLAEKKKSGGFAGFGGGLREFLPGPAARSAAVNDACAYAKWSREQFLATCASVQIGLDLLEADAAGRRVFAAPADLAAKEQVAERREAVMERLEAVK